MTMEHWKDVVGFEGLYQVSDQGQVKSMDRTILVNGSQQKQKRIQGRLISQKTNMPHGCGYARKMVTLCKGGKEHTRNVARLVAEAFLSNPGNLPCVLHKDDNPFNNSVANLEWGTSAENSRQAAERDRLRYGQEHHASAFSDVDRASAYGLLASGVRVGVVAKAFGVSHQTVSDLRAGKLKGYKPLPAGKSVAREVVA
jgi:hypothetical protein